MQAKLRKIPVEEYTSHCPFTIELETPYEEIVKIMQDHQIRHLPVVFEGRAIGIISERNLKLPVRLGEVVHLKAKDIMVSHPYKVKPKDLLQDVALEMSKNKIGSAIVESDNGKLMGIFTTTDALNALIEVVRGDEL